MNRETQGTSGRGEGHLEGEERPVELGFPWSRFLLLFLRVCGVISKGTWLGSKRYVTAKKRNNKEVQGMIAGMTERGDGPSSEPSVGHSRAEWTLASGSCLIGADKATPPEDSQKYQADCYDSVLFI